MNFSALNIFNVTQVRILLLSLLHTYRTKKIKFKYFKQILNFLEYFHFIFSAICSSRASGLERRYSSYARRLYHANNKVEVAKCLEELTHQMKNSLPSFEYFKENIQSFDCLPKEKYVKLFQYMLKKIESYYSSTNEMDINSFSIEHIMPISTDHSCVGKLGNLLPLGIELNSTIGDKKFAFKIKAYQESQYQSVIKFIEEYKDKKEWTEEDINNRTVRLAEILYKRSVE